MVIANSPAIFTVLENGDRLNCVEFERRYTASNIKTNYRNCRASTVSYDLHAKKRIYERNGVKEYIVWRTLDQAIDWFILENEKYVELSPDAAGIIHSGEFDGLRLNITAILNNDMLTVVNTWQ